MFFNVLFCISKYMRKFTKPIFGSRKLRKKAKMIPDHYFAFTDFVLVGDFWLLFFKKELRVTYINGMKEKVILGIFKPYGRILFGRTERSFIWIGSDTKGREVKILLHELAHSVDGNREVMENGLNKWKHSSSDEFKRLYSLQRNGKNRLSEWIISSSYEFFAESYGRYLENKLFQVPINKAFEKYQPDVVKELLPWLDALERRLLNG